ncbi:hypothetical protein T02_2829, partial [Trichinella nativa]
LLDVRRYLSFVHGDLGRRAHLTKLYLSKNGMGLRVGRSLVLRFRTVLSLTLPRRVMFCPVPSLTLSSLTEPNVPNTRRTMVLGVLCTSILSFLRSAYGGSHISANFFKRCEIVRLDDSRLTASGEKSVKSLQKPLGSQVGYQLQMNGSCQFPSRAYNGPATSKPVFSKGKASTTLSLGRSLIFDKTASDLLLHAIVECVDLLLTALRVGVDLVTKLGTWCGTVGQSVVDVHQL